MEHIFGRNVNNAMSLAINKLMNNGEVIPSRNGNTLELQCPVVTTYGRPWERVLFGAERDANPFFHFFESLWILAGRDDVEFPAWIVPNMASFSDDGLVFNAPYGKRMREGVCYLQDQIQEIVNILSDDPNSRQAVIQIWDERDLRKATKDKACNMSVVFRIRSDSALHMTVYNRSNDMIWGAYGANVVHFSMLQEYIAAKLNITMGTYTQVSNSFHVYTEGPGGKIWSRLIEDYKIDHFYRDECPTLRCMNPYEMDKFDSDLSKFFFRWDTIKDVTHRIDYDSSYFNLLVVPMWNTLVCYKKYGAEVALKKIDGICADDWQKACHDWLVRRIK